MLLDESDQMLENAVIYRSLAHCYAATAVEIGELTGYSYDRIHIVGGGVNAGYLNELTTQATGKIVHAEPAEATAIENLTIQMIASHELKDLKDARECIFYSFPIETYSNGNR